MLDEDAFLVGKQRRHAGAFHLHRPAPRVFLAIRPQKASITLELYGRRAFVKQLDVAGCSGVRSIEPREEL
jgi:hypothetical protein